MDKGTVIVISGPSGVGKGTVVGELLKSSEKFALSISATTRKPRNGDIDGVNYFFLTVDEFKQKIEKGLILEYAEYCGNYYGTPREYVEQCINNGKDVILEIDVQGAINIKKNMPEAITIFIMPPSRKELENRLRGRNTETEDVIKSRLEKAIDEMKQSNKYDYIVVNNTVEQCVNHIKNIITAEKMKSSNMEDFVKGVLEQCR